MPSLSCVPYPPNKEKCAIFFNFTVLPPGVRGERRGRRGVGLQFLVAMHANSTVVYRVRFRYHGPLFLLHLSFPFLFPLFFIFPSQESVDESELVRHQQLMEVIGWFFFDLLMLGYVEDSNTGLSFCIPRRRAWAIYVEVCVCVCVCVF